MISYQAPMLPDVNYALLDEDAYFSLTDLEYDTMKSCSHFLEELKWVLIEEKLVQIPQILCGYLCAYLGTITTVHTVKKAEALVPSLLTLIQHQAKASLDAFAQHPINHSVKSTEKKKIHLDQLRNITPGSIVVQTMRLGREIMDMFDEINNQPGIRSKKKQPTPFCSDESLTKLMLLMGSEQCAQWREELDGLSDHYVLNQLAIQIGWVMGYFTHLQNKSLKESQYFDYGLPLVSLFQEHIYRLMESYATAEHAKIEAQQSAHYEETESLLSEIRHLSEQTYNQKTPAANAFQKEVLIAHAGIEKTLMELITQGYEVKIILMSLFYFWFILEAPINGVSEQTLGKTDPFHHMLPVIKLVKSTTHSLPKPELSKEIRALNDSMQQLKKHLTHPEKLDNVPQKIALEQTKAVNTAIHTITCDFLKKDMSIEAITNALFSHWLRFSVFFGVSESEWQKMDYYLVEILKAVRGYLDSELGQ